MSDTAYDFAVVCEAPADRNSGCLLADRVLLEELDWLTPETLKAVRKWRGSAAEKPFLRWASVREECAQAGIKGIFGKFGGQPGAPDAYAARLALLLLSAHGARPSAVVLLRDRDGEARRRTGLEQARDERKWPFPVIIGVAEPKRECWVLAGFEPKTDDETARVEEERKRLSFHPIYDAHQLTPSTHGAKKDAKKVLEALRAPNKNKDWALPPRGEPPQTGFLLGALTQGDAVRERLCLEETPL
ncbi:MAG: hypothetical protein ABW123_12850, partial [Cystobacter sp.]